MKNRITNSIAILLFAMLASPVLAQTVIDNTGVRARCATEIEFQEQVKKDPSLLEKRAQMEKRMVEFLHNNQDVNQVAATGPRIIPVVVHVLHQNGPENISKAQIQDQIRILNEDFRRLNADTVKTPLAFKSVAADCDIEFRLAQKDTNGNCTDGIVRVWTHLTNSAAPRNLAKGVSWWNNERYLNIWVVSSIDAAGNQLGTVLGYAQFPGGQNSTDGVVIRHDYFGSIGTAANPPFGPNNKGRVATHEVGHWLGLKHIWGDDDGQCTGSDNVGDTPNQSDLIFGCPSTSTPQALLGDACSSVPPTNGIMYMNYMDYTDGACQNIFTLGQKGIMDFTLSTDRDTLILASNLISTGTDGTPAVTCAPKVEITLDNKDLYSVPYDFICAGDSAHFFGIGYNSDTINYSWTFPGGTPSTSTLPAPYVTYSTPGTYSASVVVSNSAGTSNDTLSNCVIVSGAADFAPTVSYVENFEVAANFPGKGYINNPDNSKTWTRVTNAGFSSSSSMRVENFNYRTGQADQYITPLFDLSAFSGPFVKPLLIFYVANAQETVDSKDMLNVYVSKNCGNTWTKRFTKSGATLKTVSSPVATTFTPTSDSQWRREVVDLLSVAGSDNVRVMFENVSDAGNNTYIDDITITFNVGIDEIEFDVYDLQLYPNPASGDVSVSYNISKSSDVVIEVLDILGKQVKMEERKNQIPGIHLMNIDISTLSKGVYFVNLKTDRNNITRRLIVE